MPLDSDVSYADSYAQVMTPRTRLQIRESLQSTKLELDREFQKDSAEKHLIEHGLEISEKVIDYWRAFPSRLSLTVLQNQKKKPAKNLPPTGMIF